MQRIAVEAERDGCATRRHSTWERPWTLDGLAGGYLVPKTGPILRPASFVSFSMTTRGNFLRPFPERPRHLHRRTYDRAQTRRSEPGGELSNLMRKTLMGQPRKLLDRGKWGYGNVAALTPFATLSER